MLPEDLKYYRRPSAFDLMTEEEALAFFLIVLAAALVLDYFGLLS